MLKIRVDISLPADDANEIPSLNKENVCHLLLILGVGLGLRHLVIIIEPRHVITNNVAC